MVRTTQADRIATVDRITEVAESAAPPLAPIEHPIDLSQPIDLTQLSRMTLGETSLEREVLALFDLQAGILLSRMEGETSKAIAGLAHTLTGSARGVGAWKVAEASEAVERLAGTGGSGMLNGAVATLAATVAEAQAAIGTILATR
jgi:hypothetical protein